MGMLVRALGSPRPRAHTWWVEDCSADRGRHMGRLGLAAGRGQRVPQHRYGAVPPVDAVQGSWTIAWPRLLMPAGAGISSAASFPRAASPAMAVPAAPDDGLRTSRAPVLLKRRGFFFKCFKKTKITNILKSANSFYLNGIDPFDHS